MSSKSQTLPRPLPATDDSAHGQINSRAAEVYEAFFVPALFAQWPPHLLRAAHAGPGQRLLDVACGTGVLARAAAARLGPRGSVVGVDINRGMLAVARRQAPDVEWREAPAEALPFDDDRFDAVLSQFGLMFFADRSAAIREMYRVLRPGGRLAVAVWAAVESSPGYAAMVELLQEQFGDDTAQALRAPFSLGDRRSLRTIFNEAGVANAEIMTHDGVASFPSIDSWIYTEIKGWTLADRIDDAQYDRLLVEARRKLKRCVNDQGEVSFALPAHVAAVTKG